MYVHIGLLLYTYFIQYNYVVLDLHAYIVYMTLCVHEGLSIHVHVHV